MSDEQHDMPVTESPVFDLCFDVARRLREPGFRDRLSKAGGGTADVALLPTTYDQKVSDLTDRMTYHDKGLILVKDESEPEGVKLIWWEKR